MVDTPHSFLANDPQAIAKCAIRLLESKLYRQHGLKVRLGAEVEYTLVSSKNGPPLTYSANVPFVCAADHDTLRKDGFVPAKHLQHNLQHKRDATILRDDEDGFKPEVVAQAGDTLFPDSNYVAYTYEEVSPCMYETVISHKGRHDSLEPDGSRALTFARSIEALRNSISTARNAKRNFAKDVRHNELLKGIAAEWTPIFDGVYGEVNKRTHGLHVNFSMVDNEGKSYPNKSYDQTQRLKYCLKNIFSDGAYLLLHDDSSLKREAALKNPYTSTVNERTFGDKKPPYFEISRPCANSNPYYATMLTFLGIANALDADFKLTDLKTTYYNAEIRDYRVRFEGPENLVVASLNRLEPNLGDKFMTAVKQSPPYRGAREAGTVRS